MKTAMLLALFSFCALAAPQRAQVVYGEDNRRDIYQVTDQRIQKIAKSVAARVPKRALNIRENNFDFDFAPALSSRWGGAVCEDERFASQPVISDCTGFLVGEDLLLTAGHCVLDYPGELENESAPGCEENVWVFDYVQKDHFGPQLYENDSERLYSCSEVVYAKLDRKSDFALIRLDRKTQREPLKLKGGEKVNPGDKLFVVGHPSGLPLKLSDGAKVFSNRPGDDHFSASLDTFGGNSGSPVFNAQTYEVEGILVRGRSDYVDSDKDGRFCRRVNQCDKDGRNCLAVDGGIDGEHVNKLGQVMAKLKLGQVMAKLR